MKALQDTPTAELLAEWDQLKNELEILALLEIAAEADDHDRGNMKAICQLMNPIAAELDRRCKSIEIEHRDGHAQITHNGLEWWSNPDDIDDDDLAEIEITKFETKRLEELRDLLSWLLTKGGNRE